MLSSLDDMGRLLRLKEKKMAEGKELIRFFCTLHQEADGSILFHDKSDAPKKWEKFKAYNRRDVEVKLKIQRYLSEFPVPEFVWESSTSIRRSMTGAFWWIHRLRKKQLNWTDR